MTATVVFPMALWLEGTNQNSIPANDNSLRVESLFAPCKGFASAAPSSPADHDQWIVSGAWGGFTISNIVIYLGGTWKEFGSFDGQLKTVGASVYQRSGGVWTAFSGGGGGTNLNWFVVGGFTDADMDTVVAAINASPNGGVIYLGPGTYTWTTVKRITKPCHAIGAGCADALGLNAITNIEFNNGVDHCFDFQADPTMVEKFHLKNTYGSAPTAGSAIHSTVGNGFRKIDITHDGFFDGIVLENGAEWMSRGCFAYGFVRYGLVIRNTALPDGGDQILSDYNSISKTYASTSHIRWESGGGLKLQNFKINTRGANASTGIDVAVGAGVSTVDLQIDQGSIENLNGTPIKIANASSGQLTNIMIRGVECAAYSGPAVDIEATATGKLDRVVIDTLLSTGGSGALIKLVNIDNVSIGLCVYDTSHPKLLDCTDVTNLKNSNASRGVTVLTDAALTLIDMANTDNFRWTIGGNHTLDNPTTISDGQSGHIRIKQDATGSRVLSFGSKWKPAGGSLIPLSTAGNAQDLLTYEYDKTDDTVWYSITKVF